MLKRKKDERGFTLVEIMIVVAIIGLLAAIAIPNLLRARTNANEGAIKTGMRAFSSANESYRAAQTTPLYANVITDLVNATPAYLDGTWVEGAVKAGFTITYLDAAGATYSLLAAGVDSANDYCVDQTGVIQVDVNGSVTAATTGCSGGTAISG